MYAGHDPLADSQTIIRKSYGSFSSLNNIMTLVNSQNIS